MKAIVLVVSSLRRRMHVTHDESQCSFMICMNIGKRVVPRIVSSLAVS